MKNLTFRAIAAAVIIIAGSTSCNLQKEGYVIWTFPTGGRILSGEYCRSAFLAKGEIP
jgi:hypothetical protein